MGKKVAPEEESQNKEPAGLSVVEAREVMLNKLSGAKSWRAEHAEWNRVMHEEPAGEVVHAAVKQADKQAKKAERKSLEMRKMKRYNSLLTLKVIHEDNEFLLETMDSVYLNKLSELVIDRLGVPAKQTRLLWVNVGGETLTLDSQRVFEQYVDAEWCSMPWVVYVYA